MIEIRTYEGDAHTLSRFIHETWTQTYQGKMAVSLWGPGYFDWQLLADGWRQRNYLVAAYDGSRLVGCLMAEPFRFKSKIGELNGTMSSWLTVHHDYRRLGIGLQLFEEQRRRHLERGDGFLMGYLYQGSTHSKGGSFG